jgi:hypothetical protein
MCFMSWYVRTELEFTRLCTRALPTADGAVAMAFLDARFVFCVLNEHGRVKNTAICASHRRSRQVRPTDLAA